MGRRDPSLVWLTAHGWVVASVQSVERTVQVDE